MEVGNTTTDQEVSNMPVTDGENEDSWGPQEKASARFGWVVGVMLSKALMYLSPQYANEKHAFVKKKHCVQWPQVCACWIFGESSCFSTWDGLPLRQALVRHQFRHLLIPYQSWFRLLEKLPSFIYDGIRLLYWGNIFQKVLKC